MVRHVPQTRELDLRGIVGSGSGRTRRNSTSSSFSLSPSGRDFLDANAVADSLSAIPGFKTSAAFFSFLHANLALPPTVSSAMSSNTSTPLLAPSSAIPPLSPSPLSMSQTLSPPSSSPLDTIPPLTTKILTSSDDRTDALKLIADSIAQQRQLSSSALIYHPFFIGAWIAAMAIIYKLMNNGGMIFTTGAGITMCMLVAVRTLTGGHLGDAEKLNWAFLENAGGEDDILIGSKFGSEIIGAATLRLEGARKNKKAVAGGKGKGVIRAWTVKLRYRHKDIGTGLLEECVRITREKCGKDAEVGFSAEHANSKMVLPEIFNGIYRKRERQAIELLGKVSGQEVDTKKKR